MSDSEEYDSNFVEQIINSENNSNSDNSSNESEDEEPIEYNLNLQLGASIFDVENQLNNSNIWTQTINMSNNDTLSEESAEEMSTDYNNESSTISNPIAITDNQQGNISSLLISNQQENISSLLTNSALLTPLHANTTFTSISIPDILNNNNTQNNTFFPSTPPGPSGNNTYFPSTPPGPPPTYTITEQTENIQNNPQYSMLHNDDVDNPFSKCNISPLNYDTDDEETDHLRVIFFWNYEINYEYFNLGNLLIYHSKNESFNSHLNELKNIRSKSTNNLTGKIFKLNNVKNFKNQDLVNIYLIAYYDNVKTDIELDGIFNQELDETKLIDNIKRENIYGVKGNIYNTTHTNLGDNDFIVIHRKVVIF